MMRRSQSRNELAFHWMCKGPGAGMNLTCQEIFIRPQWLEEGEVKVGGDHRAILYSALGVKKEFVFYSMCNGNPHEVLNGEMV